MDPIRGNGLVTTHNALWELVANPQLLDRARRRFSRSPPSYRFDQSGDTTASQPSQIVDEEELQKQERQDKLLTQRRASLPYHQFKDQVSDEMTRAWKNDPVMKTMRLRPIGVYENDAHEWVRNCWKEQGIWKDNWVNELPRGSWKHEENHESGSGSSGDTGPEGHLLPSSGSIGKRSHPRPRDRRNSEENRVTLVRSDVRVREHDVSRPFHQFVYQVAKDRERTADNPETDQTITISAHDINTISYEAIKATWTRRGIWNHKWGILPGMRWKHEEPLDDEDLVVEQAPANIWGDDDAMEESSTENFRPLFDGKATVAERHARFWGLRDRASAEPNLFANSGQQDTSRVEFGGLFGPTTREELNQDEGAGSSSRQGTSRVKSGSLFGHSIRGEPNQDEDAGSSSPANLPEAKVDHSPTKISVSTYKFLGDNNEQQSFLTSNTATPRKRERGLTRNKSPLGSPPAPSLGSIHVSRVSKAIGKRKPPLNGSFSRAAHDRSQHEVLRDVSTPVESYPKSSSSEVGRSGRGLCASDHSTPGVRRSKRIQQLQARKGGDVGKSRPLRSSRVETQVKPKRSPKSRPGLADAARPTRISKRGRPQARHRRK
ncbi:MAG: hypothetical protein M1821_009614 [Bathelium mastoideum]|nr:MAG: hypothetical protein M1821_009614 [Bathelium mastoideum]